MRINTHWQAAMLTVSLLSAADAATITNTLAGLSSQLHCNETWTNQSVILRFTETTASEDGTAGYCTFGIGSGFVWLYPSRLHLDFMQLQHAVTKVEVDIYDQCGAGCTKLFAYSGASQMGVVGNAAAYYQTLSLTFDTTHPDSCAIRSFEAKVNEIRISTEDDVPPKLAVETGTGSFTVSWPSNATSYLLERTESLSGLTGWTAETNSIQRNGSNFVYRVPMLAERRFFRLRRN